MALGSWLLALTFWNILIEDSQSSFNELDKLENFTLLSDLLLPIGCYKCKNYMGMNNNCIACKDYQIYGI